MTLVPRCIALAIMTLLLASAAAGREVVFGVEQSITADSNIFNQTVDPTADGSYRIGPTVRLTEDRDVLNYEFRYNPMYQVYMKTNDINGWNQTFLGTLEYKPTDKDTFELSSTAILRSAVQLLDNDGAGGTAATPGLGDTGHYTVELTYKRSFASVWAGRVTGGYDQWTYTNGRSIPNVSGYGELGAYWAPRFNVQSGLDLSSRFRKFDELGARPQTDNVISNVSAYAVWNLTPRWTANVSGGPTHVVQRQDAPGARLERRFNAFDSQGITYAAPFSTCTLNGFYSVYFLSKCLPPDINGFLPASAVNPSETVLVDFAPGTPTTSTNSAYLTFFAQVGIEYKWRRGSASLRYARTQDSSGGVASTNIVDSVTLRSWYKPERRTALSLFAAWSNRDSTLSQRQGFATAQSSAIDSDPPVVEPLAEATPTLQLVRFDTDREIMQFQTILTGTYQWTKHIQFGLQFLYTWQDTTATATDIASGDPLPAGNSRYDRYVGRVFIRYEFDPFRF